MIRCHLECNDRIVIYTLGECLEILFFIVVFCLCIDGKRQQHPCNGGSITSGVLYSDSGALNTYTQSSNRSRRS